MLAEPDHLWLADDDLHDDRGWFRYGYRGLDYQRWSVDDNRLERRLNQRRRLQRIRRWVLRDRRELQRRQ